MTNGSPRTPNWWDEISAPIAHPGAVIDHLGIASDRLSLASTIQSATGGGPAIAALLGQWCLDLKRRDPDLATVMNVLQGLDRLDRHACEPQTWQHLQAAEIAVAAYVATARGG
jgi:hypothetical protein